MMATQSDFGLAPRKKIATYGKTFRKRSQAPGFSSSGGDGGPATSAVSQNLSLNTNQSADGAAKREIESEKSVHTYGRSDRLRASQEPVAGNSAGHGIRHGTESPKAKKRKLGEPSDAIARKGDVPSSSGRPFPAPLPTPRESAMAESPKSATEAASDLSPRTTPMKDVAMQGGADYAAPFSSKTFKALDKLNVRDSKEKINRHQIPLRLTRPASPKSQAVPRKENSKLVAVSSKVQKGQITAPVRRKQRLIDTLAAQAEVESEDDEKQQVSQDTPLGRPKVSPGRASSSSPPPAIPEPEPSKITNVARQVALAKKSGPKFTYGQQRTMLAEQSMDPLTGLSDIGEENATVPFLALGGAGKTSNADPFSVDEELEEETFDSGAVRSIHELRQAGANSRFADEMDDIFDRVGSPSDKPSSLRRGALLELAQKMTDSNFRRQFRNHIVDGGLFKRMGRETDFIAGYSILSILVMLFATSKSHHLVKQLEGEGVTNLATHMLGVGTDITVFAKDKKSNVSRNGQQSLSSIKAAILQLPVWEPASPSCLSPRTLALKCTDLVLQQSTGLSGDGRLFSQALTDQLFSILASAREQAHFEYPAEAESLDTFLALHLLENHSISAMQSQVGSRWTTQHLATVADLLAVALKRPAHLFGDIESLVFRLVLNVTNNADAPAMLVNRGLLRDLVDAVSGTFDVVSKSITSDSFLDRALEALVFMIGVLINFCEHYSPSIERLQELEDENGKPVDKLIRLFLDYHSRTADADSVEKGKMNVAFGYLSVLLGYLCLLGPMRERFASFHPGKTLEPLIDAIREFIAIRRFMQRPPLGSDGDATWSEANATEQRLQGLVVQLESVS